MGARPSCGASRLRGASLWDSLQATFMVWPKDRYQVFETIPGYTDQTPASYIAHGTMMQLSHINIDLEGWYGMNHQDRLHRVFHPRRKEGEEILSP